ncbi:MAG: hypothetical protein AAF433_12430 [Bacteroidota bacterium]
MLQAQKPPSQSASAIVEVDYNRSSVRQLFKQYDRIGFIYPKKRQLLAPFWQKIQDNWNKLLNTQEELLWIFTKEEEQQNHFASICSWQQSNHGLIAQHLVSSGNPFQSLQVMLAAQYRAEHHPLAQEIQSSQNWFRPDNRYAYRVFASMYEKLGAENASLLSFQYLHLPLGKGLPTAVSTKYQLEEVKGIDSAFVNFVSGRYGQVFTTAEELDQEDIQLRKIGATYAKYGLSRSRRIFKLSNAQGQVMAAVVANRAPLGLNFSYLENRAYYILDSELGLDQRIELVQLLNAAIQDYYQDFPLAALPIVTDTETGAVLQALSARLFRTYIQSIWLRAGFSQWYDHIASFWERIARRTRLD